MGVCGGLDGVTSLVWLFISSGDRTIEHKLRDGG